MKSRIHVRILCSLLAVACVPLLVLSVYISIQYSENLKEMTLEQHRQVQKSKMDEFSTYLTKVEFISNVCFDAGVQNLLRQSYDNADLQKYYAQSQLESSFRTKLDLFSILDNIGEISIFTTRETNFFIRSGGAARVPKITAARLEWAVSGRYKGQALLKMDTLAETKGEYKGQYAYVRRINDVTLQEATLGYVVIAFDEAEFTKIFEEYSKLNGSIVEAEIPGGGLLYSDFSGGEQERGKLISRAVSSVEGNLWERNVLKTSYREENLGLTVTFYDNLALLLQPLYTVRRFTVLLVLLSIAAVAVLSVVLSKGLTRPILRLKKGIEKVQTGDFNIHIEKISRDELGELCTAFNTMADRIQTLINENYMTQLKEKEAVIASLQAQINPHFLYNTLDMVKSMAELEGADDVSEIVLALSGMFRYATKTEVREVKLAEELENLQNYIKIIHARFGKRVRFSIAVPPELTRCRIIKICLQPIVENAVSHGLVPNGGRGNIWVSVEKEENVLLVTVRDSGAGMPPEELEQLRARLDRISDSGGEPEHVGVGLQNIQDRLKLYYGENYGLRIVSEPQGGTCVRLSLPYKDI